MVSTGKGKSTNEVQEEPTSMKNGIMAHNQIPLYSSSSQRGLLVESKQSSRYLHVAASVPRRMRLKKFVSRIRLPSPSSKFRKIAEERNTTSLSVTSPAGQPLPNRFQIPFAKKIDWSSLWSLAKEWIRNPMNMALFLWITCVAISGAILFLVLTGMLNGALPKKSQRNTWFEVNNQILNALFTLMCLYQHPKRFHHLALLCRWHPKDVIRLREVYSKNGTYTPNEWVHIMVVVVLLHLNCFAQYASCGLNLGYPRSSRPAIGVGICVAFAIGAPVVASLYGILSPLEKDYDTEVDEEALEEKHFPIENQRVPEASPEWAGGIFDLWDDISLSYLSVFCSCCIFGWNMERLGFGNMYVHIATFLLFCAAPFFIFNLAAANIDSDTVREALVVTGFVLSMFGLLYGGFWRIQMRKRYNLPGNTLCFGRPAMTDCFQWLFCCFCSLAQEVRTANYYDIVGAKFFLKEKWGEAQLVLSPLPREEGSTKFKSSLGFAYEGQSSSSLFLMEISPGVEEESSMRGKNGTMKPPIMHKIGRGDNLTP